MDFGDQIALAARLVDEQPEVGRGWSGPASRSCCSTNTRTPRSRRPPCSPGSSPAPTPSHGLGHPVMAVGDPNQAIYGWRGASVSNILNFADTFPAADGEPGRLPLTVNRRSDRRILDVANRLAEPLLATYGDKVARLRAADIAGDGRRGDPRLRAGRRRARPGSPRAVQQRARRRHRRGPTIGVLSRDNAQAEEVYDALTWVGIPVEIVGLSGLIRLPEVAEVVATLTLLHDVTANSSMLTLLTGPRWAIGPRDLRLLAQRAAEIAGVRGRRAAASVADQLLQIADGIDTAELPALSDALESPGDAAYSPEARERFALLAAELRRLRSHVGDPLLDVVRRIIDTTGVDVELASATVAGRGRAARQPRPVRQGRRGVPVRRRRRDPAGPAGLPHGRGRPGQRPRRRHPDRRRLGQAAHRPPRQGPGVVVGLLRRGGGDPVPQQPVAHALDVLAGGPARTAARRPGRPAAAGTATTRPRSTPTAPRPARTTPRRSCAWATSPSPAPPTTWR